MLRSAVIGDLKRMRSDDFVEKYFFDRVPVAFSHRDDFVIWKRELSNKIEVDAASICVVGSSAVGVSLNPAKNFKLFDEKSDIDIAVVSSHHFYLAWRFLRNNGHIRSKLRSVQKDAWDDHKKNYIFWGTIATDKLLSVLPFGPQWLPAITQASTPVVGDRPVNLRIYLDYDALRAYQIQSIKKLKTQLLSGEEYA